jgi:hypothetical protein
MTELPYMDVRLFISEVLRSDEPDGIDGRSRQVCVYLGVDYVYGCTKDIRAALQLIPDGCWWHLSHLEASITPTSELVGGAPVSNAARYDQWGRPISYSAMAWSRDQLPVAICEALLKAKFDLPNAFMVNASKTEEVAKQIKRPTGRGSAAIAIDP